MSRAHGQSGIITSDHIIDADEKDDAVFSINIKEESGRNRSAGMKENKVYYLRVKLDDRNSPLQLPPTDTTSRVYDSNLQQKDRANFRSQNYQRVAKTIPNAVIVQINGDFDLNESEKSIRIRAASNVAAKLPELNETDDKFILLVKKEMIKIGKHKKLCQALKIINAQFLDWCNQDATEDELREHVEFESHTKTSYRGIIQYERKLSSDEGIRLKQLRQADGGDDGRRGTEKYNKQTSRLSQQEWGFKVNHKTGLVIFDGSKNAGSPIIRLQISLSAYDKKLYVDVYDISKGQIVNPKTGKLSCRLATADSGKKSKSGKRVCEKVNYDTIADFITPGSLILGMLEFKAVVSQAGVTLKVNLTNELYVRRAKVQRRKKKVETSRIEEMFELGDDDMYGPKSDDDEVEKSEDESLSKSDTDVSVDKPANDDDNDDDAHSDVSDDIF